MKALWTLIGGGLLVAGLYFGYKCDNANPRTVTGTVKRAYVKRYGKTDRYVVEIETSKGVEIVQVRDSWWSLDFASADRYAQCQEGTEVTATVAGYRIPLLSTFPRMSKVN